MASHRLNQDRDTHPPEAAILSSGPDQTIQGAGTPDQPGGDALIQTKASLAVATSDT